MEGFIVLRMLETRKLAPSLETRGTHQTPKWWISASILYINIICVFTCVTSVSDEVPIRDETCNKLWELTASII